MKLRACFVCALLLFTGKAVLAQQQPDPIGENLFPPELVMQHQQALGLSEDQKNFIKAEIRQAQAWFTEAQWKLQDEIEKMVSLVKQERVDEQQVLAQLEQVLNIERGIKRTHFSLLIRIKNRLTPEQQAQLQTIKSKAR